MKINRDQFVEEGYVILRQAYEITGMSLYQEESSNTFSRNLIPNLDQPATNTKKVSTITDPRKRVSSL